MIPAETTRPPSGRPLRFVWRTDRDGRFTIQSGEFLVRAGARTATALGRPWQDVAAALGVDRDGRLAEALASRATWTGLDLDWPAADGSPFALQFSGFPAFAADGEFDGYRGFALCHGNSRPRETDAGRPTLSVVAPVPNVVPFRAGERRATLTAVERNAFQEIARALESFAGDLPEPEADAAAEPSPATVTAAAPLPSVAPSADAELPPPSAEPPSPPATARGPKPAAIADLLARTSDAVRTPLHTIIGLAELILEQSDLAADVMRDYLREIRSAGGEVLSVLDDFLHVAELERAAASQGACGDLDAIVQECVTAAQGEASRARILVRTSRALPSPQAACDARSLRQIVSNLLSAAIHLTVPGGQIIVSAARENGNAVLRVRNVCARAVDSGAAAQARSEQASESGALKLSLGRAVAEASGASFATRPAPGGTFVEVVFPGAPAS